VNLDGTLTILYRQIFSQYYTTTAKVLRQRLERVRISLELAFVVGGALHLHEDELADASARNQGEGVLENTRVREYTRRQ